MRTPFRGESARRQGGAFAGADRATVPPLSAMCLGLEVRQKRSDEWRPSATGIYPSSTYAKVSCDPLLPGTAGLYGQPAPEPAPRGPRPAHSLVDSQIEKGPIWARINPGDAGRSIVLCLTLRPSLNHNPLADELATTASSGVPGAVGDPSGRPSALIPRPAG